MLVQIAQNKGQLQNLHVEQHNVQLCYAQYSLNAQNSPIVHLCIHFYFLNNYLQFVEHVLYIKSKIVHKCIFPQQTGTMQMNHLLCLALYMFVVHSCA